MIPLMGNIQNRLIHRHRVGSWLSGAGEGEEGVTADGDRASFRGWKILELNSDNGSTT